MIFSQLSNISHVGTETEIRVKTSNRCTVLNTALTIPLQAQVGGVSRPLSFGARQIDGASRKKEYEPCLPSESAVVGSGFAQSAGCEIAQSDVEWKTAGTHPSSTVTLTTPLTVTVKILSFLSNRSIDETRCVNFLQ